MEKGTRTLYHWFALCLHLRFFTQVIVFTIKHADAFPNENRTRFWRSNCARCRCGVLIFEVEVSGNVNINIKYHFILTLLACAWVFLFPVVGENDNAMYVCVCVCARVCSVCLRVYVQRMFKWKPKHTERREEIWKSAENCDADARIHCEKGKHWSQFMEPTWFNQIWLNSFKTRFMTLPPTLLLRTQFILTTNTYRLIKIETAK